ncbi:MAG: transglutaminase domain-containing protein, partial [Oscillospiraceae bacterium]|nr:transglutaminase domain-containing protein [Oscillospiraceae bacterium]
KRYEGGETYIVMPEGSFKDIAEEFEPTFENVLRINMTKSESLYLRGYVGEVYTDYGWRPLDKAKTGSYKSLFYQLYKNGFYPQTQLAKVASLLDNEITDDSVITVDTSVKGACRGYIYAPYELYQAPADLMPNDVILSTGLYNPGFNGQTKYQYKILPNQSGRSHELGKMLEKQMTAPSDELANYLAMEAKYRSFVYDNYTAISEENSALLEKYIGKPTEEAYTHMPYDTAKQNILLVLGRQLEYEEDVKVYDGEGSFLEYVVRGLQEGYAPHYATVATLMLRHYGIPARYVEGYVITPDEAESNEDGKIRLADDVAHAWTEYYHDGIGWIPFETTPPYIDIMNGVSAPPMYQQPSDPSGEEEPPEFDRDRHKDDEDEQQTASVVIRLAILLVIIARLIALWYFRRKKALDARKAACEAEDNNKAVCAMMFYMRELLDYCGIADKVNSAEALVFLIEDKWGAEAAADFGVSTIIFMKAAFSNSAVTDLERDKVGDETKRILKRVDSLQNKRGRFVAKFIKFLY